jgi:hypothetical protein
MSEVRVSDLPLSRQNALYVPGSPAVGGRSKLCRLVSSIVSASSSDSVSRSASGPCSGRCKGVDVWLFHWPCKSGSPQGVRGGVHFLAAAPGFVRALGAGPRRVPPPSRQLPTRRRSRRLEPSIRCASCLLTNPASPLTGVAAHRSAEDPEFRQVSGVLEIGARRVAIDEDRFVCHQCALLCSHARRLREDGKTDPHGTVVQNGSLCPRPWPHFQRGLSPAGTHRRAAPAMA